MWLILFAFLAAVVVYFMLWIGENQDEQWWIDIGKNSALPNKTVGRSVHSQCWPWDWQVYWLHICWEHFKMFKQIPWALVGAVAVIVVAMIVFQNFK